MGFLKKLALIWHFSLQYLAFDPRENLATLLPARAKGDVFKMNSTPYSSFSVGSSASNAAKATVGSASSLKTCPYVAAHKVRGSFTRVATILAVINLTLHLQIRPERFLQHLVKCQRQHPNSNLEICPFDLTHRVPPSQLKHHVENCDRRATVLQEKYVFLPEGYQPLKMPEPVEIQAKQTLGQQKCEEDWSDDDDGQPRASYDPLKACADRDVILQPRGLSKAQRRAFRESERVRLETIRKEKMEESQMGAAAMAFNCRPPPPSSPLPQAPPLAVMKPTRVDPTMMAPSRAMEQPRGRGTSAPPPQPPGVGRGRGRGRGCLLPPQGPPERRPGNLSGATSFNTQFNTVLNETLASTTSSLRTVTQSQLASTMTSELAALSISKEIHPTRCLLERLKGPKEGQVIDSASSGRRSPAVTAMRRPRHEPGEGVEKMNFTSRRLQLLTKTRNYQH